MENSNPKRDLRLGQYGWPRHSRRNPGHLGRVIPKVIIMPVGKPQGAVDNFGTNTWRVEPKWTRFKCFNKRHVGLILPERIFAAFFSENPLCRTYDVLPVRGQ